MRVIDKLQMKHSELIQRGPVNIVAFGDSVTQGALGEGEYHFETVYWNRLRKKMFALRNDIPVNVINAGISGITARDSVERMRRQVLDHAPDLVIVCFGLNDVNRDLDDYVGALRTIFENGKAAGAEMIFMTPNMLNTYVADDTADHLKAYAAVTAEMQNSGKMDRYMESAAETAHDCGVPVCDCYGKWKTLSETQDTTLLLANRINHPAAEMHELFAQSLFECIFSSGGLR